ncbi:class I SAM-dependent DNA methyltransferase [Alkalicoccobacillus murimartini]|uniref:Uncharacterized methyltransferase J2S05_003049 n=1 Tax=Alkalicoccobacillus murimartini TaxID=171685 RepID=A0ABT9YK60_9BACI|nr:class I SAM-dependent methyltransferase [Alkalicoccobacillus murimartini]MDQ0208240.1 putative AdoMet-dependent methyltransferase [Alkalicoccobacillus murimartini]
MGTDFTELFNQWAPSYDQTVAGSDTQYEEVFQGYAAILDAVVGEAKGHILEFGVGTGNLSKKLLEKGCKLTGIEPSSKMREEATNKLPTLSLLEGDFLNFPPLAHQIDSIVSTYAFHHLTDTEKAIAFKRYAALLSEKGRIVFADTIFESEEAKQKKIDTAEEKGYDRLAADLRSEFYTTLPTIRAMAEEAGFSVTVKPLNAYVWLFVAVKGLE